MSEKRDKREKSYSSGCPFFRKFVRGFLIWDGQPDGGAPAAGLLRVGGERAESDKLFEGSIEAFTIDVAIEETTDLIS